MGRRTATGGRLPRRSISCCGRVSVRAGIASMPRRPGISTPARRWRYRQRRRQDVDAAARRRSRRRGTAAGDRAGTRVAAGGEPRRLDAHRLHGGAGLRVLRLRDGAGGVRSGLGRELIKLEVVARSWASSLLQTSEAATSAGSSTVMLAAVISSTQPFLADGVRSVQNMELMQDFGLSHQRPHTAIGHSTRDRRKLHTTADNTLTVA